MIPLYANNPPITLFGQQAAAVEHVLTTSDRVAIIRGAAGAGKTTLMKEAVSLMEAVGKTVTVIAPTAKASRGVLKEEGFSHAETVAKLLVDAPMQEKLKGGVLWVDEAGLLGTKDMLTLLQLANRLDTRLVLGGDTRQHASVVRGDALRILNTVGGIKAAEVNKIYRQQKEEYRSAVEDLAKGDVGTAFEKLDKIKFIKVMDQDDPNKQLIDDYIDAMKQKKSTLVIAPTHAQGETLTNDIRERLRAEGLIGKKDATAVRLTNLNLTEAEKNDHRNFAEGQVVIFNQNTRGFVRGSAWIVEKSDDSEITVVNEKGETKNLPLGNSDRYDVHRKGDINLAKGDRTRITRGSFDMNGKRLDNGEELIVKSMSKISGITLYNPKSKSTFRVKNDFGHIAHAHCITSHASQGTTVDAVFISQPTNTFPATDAKQFYVSISRGREYAYIYTDDKRALLDHASNLRERVSAIELVEGSRRKDFALNRQRQLKMQNDIKPKPQIPNKITVKEYGHPEI